MNPIFVIAGNHQIFSTYLKDNELNPKDYVYLHSIERILGHNYPTIVLLNGYYNQTKLLAGLNQRGIDPLKLPFARGKGIK